MEIINENKEAGEPAPQTINFKVNEEVKWGSQFTSKRKKVFNQFLAPKPFTRDSKPETETRITIWRPKGFENTNVKKKYQSKILEGSSIVNRAALSPKQHIKLLAEPKKLRFNTHIKKPYTRPPLSCSPRIVQLAAPSTRKVITLWQDYQYTLPVQKVDNLHNLLNANCALDQRDADICFKEIEKEKSRDQRKELLRQKRQFLKKLRRERRYIQKKAQDLAEKASVYVCDSKLLHVGHYEKQIAEKILDVLITKHKIEKFNRKSTSGREYISASFYCAAFVYQILSYLETSHGGSEVSVSESGEEKEGDDEAIRVYIDQVLEDLGEKKEDEGEEEGAVEVEEGEGEEDDDGAFAGMDGEDDGLFKSPKVKKKDKRTKDKKNKKGDKDLVKLDINDEMAKLLQILQTYYNSEPNKNQRVFSSLELPFVTLTETLELLQEDIACKMAAEGDTKLQVAFEQKITSWVWQTQPDALDEPMKQTITMTSQELAIQLYRHLQSNTDVKKMQKELLQNEGEDAAPLAIQDDVAYEVCPCITTDPEKLKEIFAKCLTGIPDDCKTCYCLKEYSKLVQQRQETILQQITEVGEDFEISEPSTAQTTSDVPSAVSVSPEAVTPGSPEALSPVSPEESPSGSPETIAVSPESSPPFSPEAAALGSPEASPFSPEAVTPESAKASPPVSPETQRSVSPESATEEIGSILSGAESEVSYKGESESSYKGESSVASQKVVSTASSKAESIASSVLMKAEAEESPSVVNAKVLDVTHEVNLMPHSPDMVCCASLKAWALWIKDVAENAKNWCKWITKVINDMRYMTAVMRGEVIDPVTGRVERLKREQWTEFVIKLDEDVVAWRHYNQYIQTTTDEIVSHFKDKRVACCDLCVQENLIINDIGAEHLNEQLAEAISTTQYWQKWLQKMVEEAETLSAIIDSQNAGNTDEFGSLSTTGLPRLRATDNTGNNSINSEESFYVIESVNKKNKK